MVVGDDHDTAAFAVATIGRWWDMVAEVAAVALTRHEFHSDWNYTVHPAQPAAS